MDINKVYRRISFQGLSIQQRLPILVCILLCSIILTFSFASYYGIKKASLEMGKKRLRTLTDQLGTLFGQSSQVLNTLTLAAARHETVKKCVQSGGTELRTEAHEILNKLRNDSAGVLVELLNVKRIPVLRSGNEKAEAKLSLDTIFSSLGKGLDSCKTGKIYARGDSIYYPVVAAIIDNEKTIGYVVVWRLLTSNQKKLTELSQLMGTGATLYFGNTDGSLWTDLIRPVPNPPIDTQHIRDFFEYTNHDGKRIIAAVQPITATHWWVLVEFSEKTILEAATGFLHWIFIIGGILIVVGVFITWLMCRNIIKPLTQLTAAATAITVGDYSYPVTVNRTDELGKLANAFNVMAEKIHITQSDLENKVIERTTRLEMANKEMESFSYSVAHDLRAPLRAINGYAQILSEDYAEKLDEEAKKTIGVIMSNAKKMGELIDDLLAFSRIGKNEVIKRNVNMTALVNEVINELYNPDSVKKAIINLHPLPPALGDYVLLKQVWINLISNALKFSGTRPDAKIEIGSVENENGVTYYVKDNGVGFNMRYYDKLFGVFQRLHTQREFEGTGIGLAIVKRIVNCHGGGIWAEAKLNEGAGFFFNLSTIQV